MDNCAMASCLSERKCSKIDCGDVHATEYTKKSAASFLVGLSLDKQPTNKDPEID